MTQMVTENNQSLLAPFATHVMATLLSRLPAPIHDSAPPPAPAPAQAAAPGSELVVARSGAPPYSSRAGFMPRKPADFGDGGAYPECHVAQYPLDCGRKGASGGTKAAVVNVNVDQNGALDYSAIVTQGVNAKKTIATKHSAVLPRIHDLTEEVSSAACARVLALSSGSLTHRRCAGPGSPGPGGGGRHPGGHSRRD